MSASDVGTRVPEPVLPARPVTRRPWAVLAVISLAQFMVLLDATVVNVAIPRLQTHLHVTGAQLPWVLDAYAITFGGLLLLGGRTADLLGRRRVFLAGLVLLCLASLGCGLSDRMAELVVCRTLQGVGAAFLSPAALAIVTAVFPSGRNRHTALSIWGGLGGLGATAGVVLGGLVVNWLGWRWAFYLNLPLGLLAALLALWLVPGSRPARTVSGRQADIPGAITVTAGLLLLVYTTTTIHQGGVSAPVAVGCAILTVLLLTTFAVIERRSRAPMIPAEVTRDRGLIIGSTGQFLVGATQLSAMFLISVQAQNQLKLDPLHAGLGFLPMGVIAIAAALSASKLVRWIGIRATYAFATCCGLVGLVLFAMLSHTGPGGYLTAMLGPSLLVGIALPMGSVIGTIVGTSAAEESRTGIASGILNSAFQVGSALGLTLAATLALKGLEVGYLATAAFEAIALLNVAFGVRAVGDGAGVHNGPATAITGSPEHN
jgi:MFS family permease